MPRKAPALVLGTPLPPPVHEVVLRPCRDLPLVTSAREGRVLAATVLRQGSSRGLLGFSLEGTCLRALLATSRENAGSFARYVQSQLGWRLAMPFRFRRATIALLGSSRAVVAALSQVYRVSLGDGGIEPAFEASSVPDVLGLRVADPFFERRVVPWLSAAVRDRVVAPVPPIARDEPVTFNLEDLAEGAAAALALPDLSGQFADVIRARRAAVHVAGLDVPARKVAACLGVTSRTIQTMRGQPPDELLIEATRRQILLRASLRSTKVGGHRLRPPESFATGSAACR